MRYGKYLLKVDIKTTESARFPLSHKLLLLRAHNLRHTFNRFLEWSLLMSLYVISNMCNIKRYSIVKSCDYGILSFNIKVYV